jgi:hypothetical protein
MSKVILIAALVVGRAVWAAEIPMYHCSGNDAKFRSVLVSQVVTKQGSTVTSTMKLIATDQGSKVTEYWQSGSVAIGSDDSLRGPFKAHNNGRIEVSIEVPGDSTIVDGQMTIHLNCADHLYY